MSFFKKNLDPGNNADAQPPNIGWDKDLYNTAITQRNILGLLNVVCVAAIIIGLIWIQKIRNDSKIEPFVIEIDKKTGLATVVDPVTVQKYSGDIAVRRSLVIQYIRAREGYMYQIFDINFNDIVRVMSDYNVYYQYREKFSVNNPNSPYSALGKNGSIKVIWKSIQFPQENTAQVRISLDISGGGSSVKPLRVDKIVLMTFEFRSNSVLGEGERLYNPLGFIVTDYKIDDENPNI